METSVLAIEKIKKELYKTVVEKGYFSKNPKKVRGVYILIGGMVLGLAGELGAGFFGWLILAEELTLYHILGMFITLLGIALVILNRPSSAKKERVKYPLKGILLALGGAAGQGLGLVLSKLGMGEHDAFASTQIRVMAGLAGFTIIFFIVVSNCFKFKYH